MPDGSLGGFAATYLLILLAPGPNLLLVGAAVALAGMRGAALVAVGAAIGAATLALVLVSALGAAEPEDPRLLTAGRFAGAGVLLCLAVHFLRPLPPLAASAPATRPSGLTGGSSGGGLLLAGFVTAATNPVTAAFIVAQALGPLAAEDDARALVPGVIAMMMLVYLATAGMLMSRPACLRLLLERRRALRSVSAAVLVWSAVAIVTPPIPKAGVATGLEDIAVLDDATDLLPDDAMGQSAGMF
jgi:threonine/homoserine/homoserine lactone efflux protein